MKVIFSDLDGTLLHPQTYSFEPAKAALQLVGQQGVPLVFCTSKTRAEVEYWRRLTENRHAFIVENGGAVYIPRRYFPFAVSGARKRDDYDVIEYGRPYEDLVASLHAASSESGCPVRGFHDMTVAEVCIRTLLPVHQAVLAKRREYDEPFEILGWGVHRLLEAIERRGKSWTRGGNFYHITGGNDKAEPVRLLTALYRQAFGDVTTIGIGDGHNDDEFLKAVNMPFIVQSCHLAVPGTAPEGVLTCSPGPYGWNEAVTLVMSGAAEVVAAGQAGRN